jgi:hypothetical protein
MQWTEKDTFLWTFQYDIENHIQLVTEDRCPWNWTFK